jgi:hypothetical protein
MSKDEEGKTPPITPERQAEITRARAEIGRILEKKERKVDDTESIRRYQALRDIGVRYSLADVIIIANYLIYMVAENIGGDAAFSKYPNVSWMDGGSAIANEHVVAALRALGEEDMAKCLENPETRKEWEEECAVVVKMYMKDKPTDDTH